MLHEGAGWETALPMDAAALGDTAIAKFKNSQLAVVPRMEVNLEKKTYNEFQFRVTTDRAALFFLRDGFSPYWKAWVNDKPVDIWRAYYNFKAIALPEGSSFVRFRFTPTGMGLSLFLAYGLLIGVFCKTLWDAFSLPSWKLKFIRALGRVFPTPSQA